MEIELELRHNNYIQYFMVLAMNVKGYKNMASMRVPYTPILVNGFRSVATFSLGFQSRLKPETEIGAYGTHHVCLFFFLVPLINRKSINYTSKQ